jgi:L-malate glycosyltransferase
MDTRILLALVGDGELRPRLEQMATRIGVRRAVRFLGYRRDLSEIMAGTDIAALSSDHEGTPVSLIEAAAGGRPAVATRVGGVPEVVAKDGGLLVPSGDVRGFAMALATLARDPKLRREMGQRARAHVLGRYDTSRMLEEIAMLYEHLLRERARPPSAVRCLGFGT